MDTQDIALRCAVMRLPKKLVILKTHGSQSHAL